MWRINKDHKVVQVAEFIASDLQSVLEKDTQYTKNEFLMLLYPLSRPYKFPVHEVAKALADIKVITVSQKGDIKMYSLMPKKV